MPKQNKVRSISLLNSRFTMVISVSLVIYLLGIVILSGIVGTNLSQYVKENLRFSIELEDDIKDSELIETTEKLQKLRFIKSAKYISKEQAIEELKSELGTNPVDLLGYNPLSPSIELQLYHQYANTDSLAIVEKEVKNMNSVYEITYRQDLMLLVEQNIKTLAGIVLALALSLLFVSFLLINNTVRLYTSSMRFLIYTMRLVGATNSFIRRPILMENITFSILSAFIAIALLRATLLYIESNFGEILANISDQNLFLTYTAMLLMAIVFTIISTIASTNNFLRMKVDRMYNY